MPSPEADLNRYLTTHIVGQPVAVVMGRSATVRQASDSGVRIAALGESLQLIGLAARSLLAREPSAALAGHPLAVAGLLKARRRLLLAAWLGWSLLLGSGVAAACLWWLRGA